MNQKRGAMAPLFLSIDYLMQYSIHWIFRLSMRLQNFIFLDRWLADWPVS
jgi:hypothetical protein